MCAACFAQLGCSRNSLAALVRCVHHAIACKTSNGQRITQAEGEAHAPTYCYTWLQTACMPVSMPVTLLVSQPVTFRCRCRHSSRTFSYGLPSFVRAASKQRLTASP
jgi:hypothetical protein